MSQIYHPMFQSRRAPYTNGSNSSTSKGSDSGVFSFGYDQGGIITSNSSRAQYTLDIQGRLVSKKDSQTTTSTNNASNNSISFDLDALRNTYAQSTKTSYDLIPTQRSNIVRSDSQSIRSNLLSRMEKSEKGLEQVMEQT